MPRLMHPQHQVNASAAATLREVADALEAGTLNAGVWTLQAECVRDLAAEAAQLTPDGEDGWQQFRVTGRQRLLVSLARPDATPPTREERMATRRRDLLPA